MSSGTGFTTVADLSTNDTEYLKQAVNAQYVSNWVYSRD